MKKEKELAYSRALTLVKKKHYQKILMGVLAIFGILILLSVLSACKKQPTEIEESGDILKDLNFMGIEAEKEIGKDQMEIDYVENCTCSLTYPEIGIEEIDDEIKRIVMALKNDFLLTYREEIKEGERVENYFQYVGYETYLAPENLMSYVIIEAQMANEANVISEKVFVYLFDLETGERLQNTDIFQLGYASKITKYLISLFETDEKYQNQVFENYRETLKESETKGYKMALKQRDIQIYFDKYEIMPGSYGIPMISIPYALLEGDWKIEKTEEVQTPSKDSGNSVLENPKDDTVSGDEEVNEMIRYAIATVNIRAEATVNSKKLGILKEGETIEMISQEGEWTRVSYADGEAFIKSDYLSRKKMPHQPVELQIVDRGIDPSKPMVALTYDDGPNPKATPRILNTLEKYHAVATFFDLGQLVNTYPKIVQREEALLCEVGNHTYSHANLNILSEEKLKEEITKSEEAFEKALGHKTTLFRPAYGNANALVKEVVEYPLITWNVDTQDWKSRNKEKILEEVRKVGDYDGKIILMHSIYESTADATEVLVPELIEKGYQLVTVSELAYYKGKTLETGKVYTNF